jgi:hypothetical protein
MTLIRVLRPMKKNSLHRRRVQDRPVFDGADGEFVRDPFQTPVHSAPSAAAANSPRIKTNLHEFSMELSDEDRHQTYRHCSARVRAGSTAAARRAGI